MKRHKTLKNILGAALLAALLAPSAGWAQAYGRVALWVKDIGGAPIPDVKVTVTCKQLPKYHEEATTNKKGLAKLAFVDATKVYDVKVEKDGYPAQTFPIKAELRTTTDHFIELQKSGEAAPTEGSVRRFTPAEKVFNAGVALLGTKDFDGARASFLEALTLDAELAPAYAALAAIALETGDFDGAIARSNEFLSLSPDNPSGYYTLYEAYKKKGDTENAEAALVKFSSLDQGGDSAVLMYNEGVEAYKLGQLALAAKKFESALAVNPQLAAALLGLAKVHLDLEEFESAVARVDEFLVTDPEHYVAQRTRYEAYTALGNTAMADDAFQKLVAHHPDEVAQTLYKKGIDLFNKGNSQGAIDQFERALAASPEFAKAHYNLALSYINVGQGDQGKNHLTQFLALAPDDPDAGTAAEMLSYLGK